VFQILIQFKSATEVAK
jgi:transposase